MFFFLKFFVILFFLKFFVVIFFNLFVVLFKKRTYYKIIMIINYIIIKNKIMNNEDLKILPYTATSLSVIGRFIFMYLLYKNKSTNSLSLIFCIISICSSSMWIYYSIKSNDLPMIVRSSTELTLLSLSSIYIIRNKLLSNQVNNQILPT